jgi:hypothetical protein
MTKPNGGPLPWDAHPSESPSPCRIRRSGARVRVGTYPRDRQGRVQSSPFHSSPVPSSPVGRALSRAYLWLGAPTYAVARTFLLQSCWAGLDRAGQGRFRPGLGVGFGGSAGRRGGGFTSGCCVVLCVCVLACRACVAVLCALGYMLSWSAAGVVCLDSRWV